jgi:hypothetical protein
LHGVQFITAAHSFDSNYMRKVDLVQVLNAGVDRLVFKLSILDSPDKNSAGTAVAFFADNFGSGNSPLISQVGRQRLKCVCA